MILPLKEAAEQEFECGDVTEGSFYSHLCHLCPSARR